MNPGIWLTAQREWQRIRQDRWIFALTVWLPPLFFVLIWAIFYVGIPRDLPIAILDQDHSALSRDLTRRLDATPSLQVAYQADDLAQGMHLVRSGQAYGLVVLPHRLDTEVKLHLSPSVMGYYNSQYVLIGKVINAALQTTLITKATELNAQIYVARGDNPYQAVGKALPLRTQLTPLYNIGLNYVPFLVTAVIPALWQIFLITVVIAALGLEFRDSNGLAWLQSANGSLGAAFTGKMLPYSVWFALHGALFLWGMDVLLGWRIAGSIWLLLAAQWLTIGAYVAMGTFLYCTSFHYGRAASAGAAYTAPAFAFMGITFPVANMPGFARFWSDIIPISHYMQVQIEQMNYAATWQVSWQAMLPLCGFWLVLVPALWVLRMKLRKTGGMPV